MSTPESIEALRRANPRSDAALAVAVEAVRARLATTDVIPVRARRRRRNVTLGSDGTGPGVEDATAAARQAATVTAAAAEQSGTAVVRITHDGELWAGSTIRWNGRDLGVRSDAPDRHGRPGSESLLVGGTLYGVEDGRWVKLGSPANIDPDSGTTPAETLAAVREDVGGVTLRRLAGGLSGLTSIRRDGSTVYRGKVAAGLVARETGFKDGQALRVFPFGYVAHDEAANPAALLDAALTVGGDGVVREIALSWGAWTYTVTYSRLGATAPLAAPKNARDLLQERLRAVGRG